jgi:hypothetical protein
MKKRIIPVLLLLGLSYGLLAQAQKSEPKPKKKIIPKGEAYLAGGNISSGNISKQAFDSLIQLPLIAKDTQGNLRPVIDFQFSFAERALYEDSTGRPVIMTDYYSVACPDGKLPAEWIKMLHERAKNGDTVYVDEIMSYYPDTKNTRFYTKPLKLIITR